VNGRGAATGATALTTGAATGTGTCATMGAAAMPLKFLATTWLLVAVTTGAGAATMAAGAATKGACNNPGLAATQATRAKMTTVWMEKQV